MDFVEKIFGISPDGGSGAFEVLLYLLPLAGLTLIVLGRRSFRLRARDERRRR